MMSLVERKRGVLASSSGFVQEENGYGPIELGNGRRQRIVKEGRDGMAATVVNLG